MSTSIATFFATQANAFLARLRNKGQPNRSNHEAVAATDLLSELLQRQMSLRENAEAKIEALQVALCRWLPVVSLDNSELSETIASDAMLLIGMKSETPRECWMEIYPTMKADLEREQGVRVDAQRQLRELQAARDAGADLDCDDRRDDAEFWWSVAAFRGIELARQMQGAQEAEASELLAQKACESALKSALNAENELDKIRGWKDAVTNACVIANINYDDNPVASLDRLISWHENTVLDPQISERAAVLCSRTKRLHDAAITLRATIGGPITMADINDVWESGAAKEIMVAINTMLAEVLKDEIILSGGDALDDLERKRFERAPCYLCGYNGEGYYQPGNHPCAAMYHRGRP